ncbi:hypothetical protein [Klebsiella quasipneumoniae]|uniref:hypothetical protein n=1 Tax=Klebsiella quasipneumoniae TaxID=1463165 RepID=UPI001E46A0B2|nr:hypothetical protein [Klebsiella quasipneumoniae]
MNRKPEKKEPKPVPQSANYLDPKLYEELVGAANSVTEAVLRKSSVAEAVLRKSSVAEAVFRNSDWKLIFRN